MTETNGYGEPDLHRIIHSLQLDVSSMASKVASKDQGDNAQTRMMLKTIGKFVSDQLKPLRKEIADLKARLEEIEKRGIDYRGAYQRSNEYRRGSMVTHDHSVWACIEDAAVNESPGSHPSRWQMCLRGDGREQRLPTAGGARATSVVQRRTP
jgi:hypothetical protein